MLQLVRQGTENKETTNKTQRMPVVEEYRKTGFFEMSSMTAWKTMLERFKITYEIMDFASYKIVVNIKLYT